VTKHRSRDKESLAKSHRNKIVGTSHPKRMKEALGRFYGSSRGELSTAEPREAKAPEVLDSGTVFMVIREH